MTQEVGPLPGPIQPGLSPKDASDKLSIFQNQFDSLWRKHGSYSVGEDPFGLDHTEQSGFKDCISTKRVANLPCFEKFN